jgi:uncharacterized protein (DUF1684 family)
MSMLLLVAIAGCRSAPQPIRSAPATDTKHERSILEWRTKRAAKLKRPGGWLRLAGLHWLEQGQSTLGSRDAKIVLPAHAPVRVGTLTLDGDEVTLSVEPSVTAYVKEERATNRRLASDAEPGGPDRVRIGDLTLLIIKRGGRLALRLFDDRAKTLETFKGLSYFPVSSKWRVSARLEAYPEPRKVAVSTVIETTEEMTAPGELVFSVDGRELRLVPFAEPGSPDLFIVFADKTNGEQTYGGGRFLSAKLPPEGGAVELDFNRAVNPPCAFTAFATCPVPRKENRLPVAVTAGEKAYGSGH